MANMADRNIGKSAQSTAFKAALAQSGLSQESAAAMMGVSYQTFRRVVNGHLAARAWFIARFYVIVTPTIPNGVSDTELSAAALDRLSMLTSLLGGAAMLERENGLSDSRESAWRKRPAPFAPACEVES